MLSEMKLPVVALVYKPFIFFVIPEVNIIFLSNVYVPLLYYFTPYIYLTHVRR